MLDPTIRLLHALQSLIYVAMLVLARRNSPWGLGAGCFKSGFWNSVNLFIAVVAFTGNCLVFFACLVAFLRSPRQRGAWFRFVAGGLLTIGFFMLITITTAPQFIRLLKNESPL